MALDDVTSHFSTMFEPIASASFLSSLSITHGITHANIYIRNTCKYFCSNVILILNITTE